MIVEHDVHKEHVRPYFRRLLAFTWRVALWSCFFCLLCFSLKSVAETVLSSREFSSGIGDCPPRKITRRLELIFEKGDYKLFRVSRGLSDIKVWLLLDFF